MQRKIKIGLLFFKSTSRIMYFHSLNKYIVSIYTGHDARGQDRKVTSITVGLLKS